MGSALPRCSPKADVPLSARSGDAVSGARPRLQLSLLAPPALRRLTARRDHGLPTSSRSIKGRAWREAQKQSAALAGGEHQDSSTLALAAYDAPVVRDLATVKTIYSRSMGCYSARDRRPFPR